MLQGCLSEYSALGYFWNLVTSSFFPLPILPSVIDLSITYVIPHLFTDPSSHSSIHPLFIDLFTNSFTFLHSLTHLSTHISSIHLPTQLSSLPPSIQLSCYAHIHPFICLPSHPSIHVSISLFTDLFANSFINFIYSPVFNPNSFIRSSNPSNIHSSTNLSIQELVIHLSIQPSVCSPTHL